MSVRAIERERERERETYTHVKVEGCVCYSATRKGRGRLSVTCFGREWIIIAMKSIGIVNVRFKKIFLPSLFQFGRLK